jgi:hypothetical protein
MVQVCCLPVMVFWLLSEVLSVHQTAARFPSLGAGLLFGLGDELFINECVQRLAENHPAFEH